MDERPMQKAQHGMLVSAVGGVICCGDSGFRAAGVPFSESPSSSMASISSEGSTGSPIMEQEEIAALTHDVRMFKEALGKLKRVFSQEHERLDSLRVSAHERLSEVLRVLRCVLEKYPSLQSAELLSVAGTLIQHVKGYNYEDDEADPKEFFECIDQLALAFSRRVSEYLMGDIDVHVPTSVSGPGDNKTKSCENITSDVEEQDVSVDETRPGWLTPQQIDGILLNLERGVEYALHRAKLWSKYAKDLMIYIEKRTHATLEFTKNMAELCRTVRPLITEEDHLPLQSLYCAALDHDIENSRSSQMTSALLLGNQFLEPMSLRRSELERGRKHLKETWQREIKKMHDAVARLWKPRNVYVECQKELMEVASLHAKEEGTQEYDQLQQVLKSQRQEIDAVNKAVEAESAYRSAVAEANEHHLKLRKIKAEILQEVRKLIIKCDQTMKAVTINYFQLQHDLISPLPLQFQTLHESSKLYEPGLEYMEFVKQFPRGTSKDVLTVPYTFEPFQEETTVFRERKSLETVDIEELDPDKLTQECEVTTKSWATVMHGGLGSDTDSISSSPSCKSLEFSPTVSPMMPGRKLICVSSGDELENDQDADFIAFEPSMRRYMSKAAVTHNFRKLKTPSRCRECDSYVYFQGADCSECGLACHKKCLETLAIQCGHKRLPRKMTTFGVELGQHLKEACAEVPYIVCKCVNEIHGRGMCIKGVYRVSGVKSKVEKLCQAFENGMDLVDLTDIHANVIANVLKLYLRQLPEPLLTFRLYADFIRIAKEFPTNAAYERKDPAAELKGVIKKLPKHHYATLAVLMQHLKQVSEMSEANKMPASNLGIVFGPTLLRTSEGCASLNSLVDTVHQTRAVELMIIYANDIFGPVEFPVKDTKRKLDSNQVIRSSSYGAGSKTKNMDSEASPQDISFVADTHSAAVSSIHFNEGRCSQKKDVFSEFDPLDGTLNEELPEFLLTGNSYGKVPASTGNMAKSKEKILKISLRDYQGLEGFSSSATTSSEVRENEHRRLRKSRSDVTPTSGCDHITGDITAEEDRHSDSRVSSTSTSSLKEDTSKLDGKILAVDHITHLCTSSGSGKSEGSKNVSITAAVRRDTSMDSAVWQDCSRLQNVDVVQKVMMRRLDVSEQEDSFETARSLRREEKEKESPTAGMRIGFMTENLRNITGNPSPSSSKNCVRRMNEESPFDSYYGFESHHKGSMENKSPRDVDEKREIEKKAFPRKQSDDRCAQTDCEMVKRFALKGMQEEGEAGKDTNRMTHDQYLTKTVNTYGFNEAQNVVTSNLIGIQDSNDYLMVSDGIEGITGTVLDPGDTKHSSEKREGKSLFSVLTVQGQHSSRDEIVENAENKPSHRCEESKPVMRSKQEGYGSDKVNTLISHEETRVPSSLTMCAPSHLEVRQDIQRTSVEQVEVRQERGKKVLNRVGETSFSGVYLSCGSVKPCRSDHVKSISSQKSIVHGAVNVSQTSNITNLMQAQCVASFSAPAEKQPGKSVLRITQTKKGSKKD